MTRWYAAKTIGLTAICGMLLAALLAIAISEFDQYYDWLLVKQSLGLGLAAGLVAGTGVVYYPSIKHRFTSKLSTVIASQLNRRPVFPKAIKSTSLATAPGKISWSRIWGTFGRSSLGGVLGLLFGGFGGIWFCAEAYGDLSSDAQGWILFYLPFYAITVLFCAAMGSLAGALFGLVWSFRRN